MLKKCVMFILCSVTSISVLAKDDIGRYSVSDLLARADIKSVLHDVPLYFGDSETPKVLDTFGEVVSNKKTNGFMKDATESCQWVMLSALKSLQERAQKEGMNGVINIRSYYKKKAFSSQDEFECAKGFLMSGVTLKGTLVKLEN